MDTNLNKAIALITAQQGTDKGKAVFWVGEQMKDICNTTQGAAELVAIDLEMEGMSIADAEKKIAAYASKHRSGASGCCPPQEADKILRQFYGIAQSGTVPDSKPESPRVKKLTDFM